MNIAIFLLMMASQAAQPDTVRLSLEEAVSRALEANPTLLAQEARADARAQLPLQASPAFLPSVSLGLQGMRTTDPVGVFGLKLRQENFAAEDLSLDALNRPDAYSGYNATATVQMPLLAPEGLYGFQAARKAAEAERAGARRAAGATRFFTVQAYTGALLAARQVEALDTALAAVRGHVTQAEAMHEQGLVTGLDARMAGLKASEIEVHRLAADAQAQNALSALKALLDLPDSTELLLTDGLSHPASPSALRRKWVGRGGGVLLGGSWGSSGLQRRCGGRLQRSEEGVGFPAPGSGGLRGRRSLRKGRTLRQRKWRLDHRDRSELDPLQRAGGCGGREGGQG